MFEMIIFVAACLWTSAPCIRWQAGAVRAYLHSKITDYDRA